MPKEVENQFDQVVPGAAHRASQFLGVVQKRCHEEGLEINLQPARRGLRDNTVVLRSSIKAGRNNVLELEVFADPMGTSLHVGWQATRPVVGGSVLASRGIFAEFNAMSRASANNAGNIRALSGILQAFQVTVFLPVLQQLADAVAVEQGIKPGGNGFLGV